nr:cell cycle checkpoint protein rad17 [Quercus suber]
MPLRSARRKVTIATSSDDEVPGRQRMPNTSDSAERSELSNHTVSSTVKNRANNDALKVATRSNRKSRPAKTKETVRVPTSPSSTRETSYQRSPECPRTTSSKVKTCADIAAKPSSRPIYSFFNAATQRQVSSQSSASPEKRLSVSRNDELETIESEDEAIPSLNLSNDASIAFALRKRKVQHTTSFDDNATLPLPSTQKFRRTGENSRKPSFSSANIQETKPWTERFAPVNLGELAVHKRKVQDVSGWLQGALRGRRHKILVLKGPAGTAKTITVQLLAKDLGIEVVEWRNPGGADAGEGSLSVSGQFEEFVNRAGRSGGLQFASSTSQLPQGTAARLGKDENRVRERPHVLLVEEFPTTLTRTSASLQSFRSTVLQYVSSSTVPQDISPTPIVMVISETLSSPNTAATDSVTAHRLLGPELANHPYIDTFEFNPIAPTFLIKALELADVKEARQSGRRRTPGPEVFKRLAESGDIRSAVSGLEFMCLRGDNDIDMWSSKVAFTKLKKRTQSAMTKREEEVLQAMTNRGSSLGIFHAVGRICYNNRVDPASSMEVVQPPEWLPQTLKRPKVPERDVNELINELGTDISTFIAALHENYAHSCNSASAEMTLNSLVGSIDNLSDADLLNIGKLSTGTWSYSGSTTESLRQDEIAFQAAIRGLLFSLPYPVHRSMSGEARKGDSHKMFYPASLKAWRRREEVEDAVEVLMLEAQNDRRSKTTLRPWRRAKSKASGDQVKGVDMWARENAFPEQDDSTTAGITGGQDTSHVGFNKTELLLERLPYAAHIFRSHHSNEPRESFLDLISRVTRITGQAQEYDGNSENEEVAGYPADTPSKATHHALNMRSVREAPPTRAFQSTAKDDDGSALTEAANLGNLVLADDDIED